MSVVGVEMVRQEPISSTQVVDFVKRGVRTQ